MKFRYLLPQDIGAVAFAIYRGNDLILQNPAHRALFSPSDIPAIPEDDRRAYYFEKPVPHLAVRNGILLAGKTYSVFSMLPLGERHEKHPPVQEDVSLFQPIRDLFSLLFSFSTGARLTIASVSVTMLFRDCCAALRKGISSSLEMRISDRVRDVGYTPIDREGLMICLGGAISYMARSGCRISAALDRAPDGTHTMTFLSDRGIENEFQRDYILAVAAQCGFSVTMIENGICFTLPYHYPTTHALHATGTNDDCYYLTLGKLLFEA